MVASLILKLSLIRLIRPLFYDPKIDLTPMEANLTTIVRYGAGILFFDNLSSLPFAVLRLEHQALRFAAIRLTGVLVTLALNFVFIVRWGLGVRGIFLANLLSSFIVLILLLPTILPRLTWRLDWDVLKKFLPFGLTNVPAYLSSMMVQVIDRPIVQAYLG
jgi:O-antigen/teichoic acid export membrane protein